MFAGIILTRDDFARLLESALPLTIHLGAPESGHSLRMSDLGDVRLLPDSGLQVTCKARVHWPLLGIDVPVTLDALTTLLIPEVDQGTEAAPGDRLAFRASVEHASFAMLPSPVADRVTAAINERLAAKDAALVWNFTSALTFLAKLPSGLDPLESFALRPSWAKIRVTSDAVVYAASFESALLRRGDAPPFPLTPPATEASGPAAPLASRAPRAPSALAPVVPLRLVTAGVFALGLGVGYLAFHRAARARTFL